MPTFTPNQLISSPSFFTCISVTRPVRAFSSASAFLARFFCCLVLYSSNGSWYLRRHDGSEELTCGTMDDLHDDLRYPDGLGRALGTRFYGHCLQRIEHVFATNQLAKYGVLLVQVGRFAEGYIPLRAEDGNDDKLML